MGPRPWPGSSDLETLWGPCCPSAALPVALTAGSLTPGQARLHRQLSAPRADELIIAGGGGSCRRRDAVHLRSARASGAPHRSGDPSSPTRSPGAHGLRSHQALLGRRRVAGSRDSQGPTGQRRAGGRLQGGSLQVRLTRVPILILPLAGCVSSGKWLSLSESGFLLCCRYLMAGREDTVGEVKGVGGAWPIG